MRPKCMRCVVYIELYYPTEDSLSARPTIFIWARGYIASWHHPVTLMHTFARPVQMLCQCLMNRSFNCWLQILTYDSVLLRLLFCCRFILHHANHGFNSFLLPSCNRSIMRLESPVSAENDHLNKKNCLVFLEPSLIWNLSEIKESITKISGRMQKFCKMNKPF